MTAFAASGMWNAEVTALALDTISVRVPRLTQWFAYDLVPYIGPRPAVGDRIWVTFREGRPGDLVAFTEAEDSGADITDIIAGTNLVGGGTSGSVTLSVADTVDLAGSVSAFGASVSGGMTVTGDLAVGGSVSMVGASVSGNFEATGDVTADRGFFANHLESGASTFAVDVAGGRAMLGASTPTLDFVDQAGGSVDFRLQLNNASVSWYTQDTTASAPVWDLHKDIVGGQTRWFHGDGSEALRLNGASVNGIVLSPSQPKGGFVVDNWPPAPTTYTALRSAGWDRDSAASTAYLMLSDANNTFISCGPNGDTYIRANGNSATHQIRVRGDNPTIIYGGLDVGLGTDVLPSITFGDANTGIYATAAGRIDFSINGNNEMRLGTSGDLYALRYISSVGGRYYFGGTVGGLPTGDAAGYIQYVPGSSGYFNFVTSEGARARVYDNGNIFANQYLVAGGRRVYFGNSVTTASTNYILYNDTDDGSGIEGTYSFYSTVSGGSPTTTNTRIACGAILAVKTPASLGNYHDDEDNVIHVGTTTASSPNWADVGIIIEDDSTVGNGFAGLTGHNDANNYAPIWVSSTQEEAWSARNNGNTGYCDIYCQAINDNSLPELKTDMHPMRSTVEKARSLPLMKFRRKQNADPKNVVDALVEKGKRTEEEEWTVKERERIFAKATPGHWRLLEAQMHGEEFLEHGVDINELAERFPEACAYEITDWDTGDMRPHAVKVSSTLFTLWKAWQESDLETDRRIAELERRLDDLVN